MKFKITVKDPDGIWNAVDEQAGISLIPIEQSLSKDELAKLHAIRREQFLKDIEGFVDYNEYITIEFDTVAGTATVCPC